MFTQNSLDMLYLLKIPIAGYHKIGRDDTAADFTRKIKASNGFVYVYPLMISKFTDYFGKDNVQPEPVQDAEEQKEAPLIAGGKRSVTRPKKKTPVQPPPVVKAEAPRVDAPKAPNFWNTAKPPADWPKQYFKELASLLTHFSAAGARLSE